MNAIQCRLRHQQTDWVVSEQMNPKLFFNHARCEATRDYDTECSFDVAQIQHDVPALRVQPFKRAFHVYESQYSIVSKL
jgi:hypothetical protein